MTIKRLCEKYLPGYVGLEGVKVHILLQLVVGITVASVGIFLLDFALNRETELQHVLVLLLVLLGLALTVAVLYYRQASPYTLSAASHMMLLAPSLVSMVVIALDSEAPLCSPAGQFLDASLLLSLVLFDYESSLRVLCLFVAFWVCIAVKQYVISDEFPFTCLWTTMATSATALIALQGARELRSTIKDEQQARSRTNSSLTSLIFHQVRTPLQSIMATIYQLNDPKTSPNAATRRNLVRDVSNEVAKVSIFQTLINEFLYYDTGQATVNNTSRVVADELDELCKVHNKAAGSNALPLSVGTRTDMDKMEAVLPWADFRSALTLFVEVVQHGEPQSVVMDAARHDRRSLRVSLHSSGVAQADLLQPLLVMLTESDLHHIELNAGELDMSMLLCRRILEHIGARVSTSTQNGGSVIVADFVVPASFKRISPDQSSYAIRARHSASVTPLPRHLPEQQVAVVPGAPHVELPQHAKPAEANARALSRSDSTQFGSGMLHIVYVEDNALLRKTMATLTKTLGYKITTAVDGLDALNVLDGLAADLIVMDLQMPNMNGIDCARALRDRGCNIPIIALSAGGLRSDVESCREVGMNGYYTKPVTRKCLSKTIRFHLKHKEWRET